VSDEVRDKDRDSCLPPPRPVTSVTPLQTLTIVSVTAVTFAVTNGNASGYKLADSLQLMVDRPGPERLARGMRYLAREEAAGLCVQILDNDGHKKNFDACFGV